MRLGIIGPLEPDSFADNIAASAGSMGIDVVAVGAPRKEPRGRLLRHALELGLRVSPETETRLQQASADTIIESECDLVISVSSALMPRTVERFRRADIPVALWFPDALANMDRQLMLIADYNMIYFKDPLLVQRLSALTHVPVAYLPEACNPIWHRPIDGERGDAVVLAGNMYPTRIRLLDRLVEENVPLELYGAGFPRWVPKRPLMSYDMGRFITREEKSTVFRNSLAVLNNLHPAELTSVNARLFEAAAAGAAVLCEDRPALHDLFEVGTEVLAFTSFEELMAHISALQQDPALGRRIGDAAAVRALSEHTYGHRLRRILEDLL